MNVLVYVCARDRDRNIETERVRDRERVTEGSIETVAFWLAVSFYITYVYINDGSLEKGLYSACNNGKCYSACVNKTRFQKYGIYTMT